MKPQDLPEEYFKILEQQRFWGSHKTKIDRKGIEALETVNSFPWNTSLEGEAFWRSVDRAKTIDELPKIPQFDVFSTEKIQFKAKKCFYPCSKTRYRYSLIQQSITNCGITILRSFNFPRFEPTKDQLKSFNHLCKLSVGNYPRVLATHNSNYKEWFSDWNIISEFINPNSGNKVYVFEKIYK